MTNFKTLAGIPVWYHNIDSGNETISEKEREFPCSEKLAATLEDCFTELFEIWPLPKPKAILSMGSLGDGKGQHGTGNAFDLSGFVMQDGSVIRVLDYQEWVHLLNGINAHLFSYFPQVLSHFYPKHSDHFHVDFNNSTRNHYRNGSDAQTFFIQAILRHTYGRDLGGGGRYRDGIDGKNGGHTKQSLDAILHLLLLTGGGGLENSQVWRAFLSHARADSFACHQQSTESEGADSVSLWLAAGVGIAREYGAIAEKVHNRDRPPREFLDTLIRWARQADDQIFERNEGYDIYSRVAAELGPWQDLNHRKAVICEVLRVLAGFESSWDWNEGRDISANNTAHDSMEIGIFQCSSNSLGFFRDDPYLEVVLSKLGIRTPGPERSQRFEKLTKEDHFFAIEYCARLLRHTIYHHGPVKHYNGHIYKGKFHDGIGRHLDRNAVSEFLIYLG